MNPVQNLRALTLHVVAMAEYSAEDYQETETAVLRGLEIARVKLVQNHRQCSACGSIDINASGVCQHCGTKAAN